jgi:hypothetical protein
VWCSPDDSGTETFPVPISFVSVSTTVDWGEVKLKIVYDVTPCSLVDIVVCMSDCRGGLDL